MSETPTPTLGQDILDSIRCSLRMGRPVDGLAKAATLGPLDTWLDHGPESAFYAIRLYSWLGNGSRADAMAKLARIRYPDHAGIFLAYLSFVARTRGAIVAWRLAEDRSTHPKMDVPQQVFLANVIAGYYINWSDFATAFDLIEVAEKMRPGHDRTGIQRSRALIKADRRDEAFEVLEDLLLRYPNNTTVAKQLAELLIAKGRDEEALDILTTTSLRVQDFDLELDRANWHSERALYTEALEISRKFEELQPLANRYLQKWIAGWRAFRHYLKGDYPQALAEAAKSPDSFIAEVAERLRSVTDGKRVQLDVPFVRQDRRTCGPATLAAICRYWGESADQVEIAEEICYDGTPDHSERNWADEHGYHAREFRVTPETIRNLIDLGIPFTLTTVEPASAHLQAVIGYDSTADTMLIREPGWAEHAEYRMSMLDDYEFCGPRGMLLIPQEKSSLLKGVVLPEAELYDLLHQMRRSLHVNQRDVALVHLQALRQAAPGHRLVLVGERALTQFDGNPHAQLEVYESMLRLFPEEPALLYGKMRLLHSTAGRREQISFAKKLVATGKAPKEVRRELADLLDDDARDLPEAMIAWHQAAKISPYDAATLTGLADLKWNQMCRKEATKFYRLAACVEILSEHYAQTYFNAARWLGAQEQEEAMVFLRQRVKHHGGKSGDPARTLSWALGKLDRQSDALQVLEEAMKLRPEDGPLLLYAADTYRFVGQLQRASELTAVAEKFIRPTDWLRRVATDAISRAQLDEAIHCYRKILESEPMNREIHSSLANLLAGTAGREAAVKHLEGVCATYSGSETLHVLLANWLDDDTERRMEVLRHLVNLNPAHAWARRELAIALKEVRRFKEAEAEAMDALRVEPWSEYSHGILGGVLVAAGKTSEAASSFRKALEINADYDWAITELVRCITDVGGRREALLWLVEQMEKQVITGDGLARWQEEAWPIFEPEEILSTLEEVQAARPDLWLVWSLLGKHLRDMGRVDKAIEICEMAAEKFPFLPRVWFDLAVSRSRQGDPTGEKEALEKALSINPNWMTAVRRMASVCETLNEPEAARTYLEGHSRVRPLDTDVLMDLASLLRRIGEKQEARVVAERAVSLSPLVYSAWVEWAQSATGDEETEAKVLEEARRLTDKMPKNSIAWECRGRVAAELQGYAEELKILDEALLEFPSSWDFLDRKGLLLAEYGRYAAALECCSVENVPESVQHFRVARRADILNRQGLHKEAIREMETLVGSRPDYSWAVARLVEWYDHLADHEKVLYWSTYQARISPSNSVAHGYQADALLKLGRKADAEQALRRAITLDAGYNWAGRQLLGLELERGDLEAAERTVARIRGRVPISTLAMVYNDHGHPQKAVELCRSAVAMDSTDWRNHNALAEALWELNEKNEALQAHCDAAKLVPRNYEIAEKLGERATAIKRESEIALTLADWVRESPDLQERHFLRCRYLNLIKKNKDRLTALDEAIAGLENPTEFVDLKIAALASERRYTDALKVCDEHDNNEAPNPVIRRRKAWVESERGDQKTAISIMAEALTMDDTNLFGLQKICDWLENEDRPEEAVTYAETLVEAHPEDAVSFGFLASALLRSKREAEAEPHLKRAFRMWNEYTWAGDNLFRIQLERKDFQEAETTLRMVKEHLPGAGCILKEVQLASAQKNEAAAFDAWLRLTNHEAVEVWQLKTAEKCLSDAGWEIHLERAWKERMGSAINLALMEQWVERNCSAGRSRIWRQFKDLNASEPLMIAAWSQYLKFSGGKAKTSGGGPAELWYRETMSAIWRNRKFFKQSTTLWGWVAWFFTCTDNYFRGRRWVKDWRTRPNIEGWMTVNIALLLDGPWRSSRALLMREWALANVPMDHGASFHRVTLALASAARGELANAKHHLNNIRDNDFDATNDPKKIRFRVRLARLLVDLQDQSVDLKTRRIRASEAFLLAEKEVGGPAFVSRSGLRCVFLTAIKHGGISKFTWHIFRHIGRLAKR